ncbi:MAG: chorismate synthase, partial [Flavobacteriales bacterium]|nr:chorismate synthase [Flavobacteriales bacterium]
VLDGMPPGIEVDTVQIQRALDRRRPGQSALTSPRNEPDQIEILSGILNGKTLGTPIGFIIRNRDQKSEDYAQLENTFRPGHADEAWQKKFGIRDHRGGGRSSARETACRVAAGAMARALLNQMGVEVSAYTSSVGEIELIEPCETLNLSDIDNSPVRCPHAATSDLMVKRIESARNEGDSVGGTITCVCKGVPASIGEPVFGKLHAWLSYGMLTIPASKGFEMLKGFENTQRMGSETNTFRDGVSGGISTGDPLVFRVAFKPVSSISREQKMAAEGGAIKTLDIVGRHDPCVLPRAVPVVESMALLVLADFILINKTNTL